MNTRRAENEIRLYKQIQFLNTRMRAYEKVLSSRKAMLKAIFNPEWLKQAVDVAQLDFLAEHDREMREAAEKVKAERPKAKLTIVGSI